MRTKIALAAGALLLSVGCGGGGNIGEMLTVQPSMATATHGAIPPSNSGTFTAFDNANCPMTGPCMMGSPVMATWTSSDMTDTSVVNNSNGSGTVTCIAGTPMMIVITATANSMNMPETKVSATASLTCQ